MAIRDYNFFHGAALSLIVSEAHFTVLGPIQGAGAGAYAVNQDRCVFIKHSVHEDSPWQFTFAGAHQEAIRGLFDHYHDNTFIALVCGRTGVCLLTYGEYANAIGENFQNNRYIRVRRPGGGGFRVIGSGGDHQGVIPLNRFPGALFA